MVGTTGSGKTTLARALLSQRQFVVVHDGKGNLNWPGYRLVRRLKDAWRLNPRQHPRIIYRPTIEEMRNLTIVNGFFRWVYHRQHTTLYVDEVYAVVEPFAGTTPPYFHACITRGRERRIEVWSSFQRPTLIPLSLLSESEHFFVFRLQWRDDRKRVESSTGLDEESIALLPKRHFYYVAMGEPPQGPLTLNLK